MLLDTMLFVGLDIGGTNIKAGILDGNSGDLIGQPVQEALCVVSRSPEVVVDRLVSLAQSLLDEQGIAWEGILYVGIACPGQIDREKGVVVGASTFPSWSNVPLADMVQDRVSRPATVLNDASAAASAEFAGRGSQETIAVLTLGTGIGLGVVCAGRVVTGCRGLIEGGHMIVEPGPTGRPCACGQRGCLEAYASASAVATIASERLNAGLPAASSASSAAAAASLSPSGERTETWEEEEEERGAAAAAAAPPAAPSTPVSSPGVSSSRRKNASMSRSDSAVSLRIRELERRTSAEGSAPGGSPSTPRAAAAAAAAGSAAGAVSLAGTVTAADVFSMARRGDEVAVRVVEETCDYLGVACVNICRVLDPDAILLTGGLSKAEGLVDKVRSAFSSRGWKVLPHECEINLASTCVAAGVIGAAGAAASEYALAKRRNRRRSSDGNMGYTAAGSGSVDGGLMVGKRGSRGWGLFLVGVGVGAVVSGIAVVVSSRSGRNSSR